MYGMTTGKDICHNVCQNVADMNLPWQKRMGLVTNRAPAMCNEKWTCGKDTGKESRG